MLKTIKFWYLNTRPRALPQSVMPAALAVCLASRQPDFVWWAGLIAVVGVAFAHSGMNLFDDYFDWKVKHSDYRNDMVHRGFRARLSKCPYLVSGAATEKDLLKACCTVCGIALLLGIIIFWFRGASLIIITLIAAFFGVEYSGPPIRLSYRGLGDLVIGLMFGPLAMTGVYISACGHFDWSMLFISVPVGLLVANIVYTHSIMDFEPDREVGKMTFAVLLGNKTAQLVCQLLLILISYISIAIAVITGYLSAYYLLVLLTLPMAVELCRITYLFVKEPERQLSPKWWYGRMGNFERFRTLQIDWFMIRWLLSRNLLTLFCAILIIVIFVF
jgi:1,4-dihydroxy-2-naphthoate octaprenyltransferase